MVLSNAERQARYRERLKQLAARGLMSAVQSELLSVTRKHLREWRRSVAAFAEGRMRTMTNNVDTTSQHVSMLKEMIARNEALLAQYDPEGVTADGNIEIGDVPPSESSGVLSGRWVSYSLDKHGCAIDLRLYDAEAPARADAAVPGRHVGVVADDMWSISAPSSTTIFALLQRMPSGWWKALVSGWVDLPEQYGLNRDLALSEIAAVAAQYVRQRVERGFVVPKSIPTTIAGWDCVPLAIEIDP
jgi:hypothetical protein